MKTQNKTYWEKYKNMYGEKGMLYRFYEFLNRVNKRKEKNEKNKKTKN